MSMIVGRGPYSFYMDGKVNVILTPGERKRTVTQDIATVTRTHAELGKTAASSEAHGGVSLWFSVSLELSTQSNPNAIAQN